MPQNEIWVKDWTGTDLVLGFNNLSKTIQLIFTRFSSEKEHVKVEVRPSKLLFVTKIVNNYNTKANNNNMFRRQGVRQGFRTQHLCALFWELVRNLQQRRGKNYKSNIWHSRQLVANFRKVKRRLRWPQPSKVVIQHQNTNIKHRNVLRLLRNDAQSSCQTKRIWAWIVTLSTNWVI